MYLRRLKDVSKKTSQKRRLFWDVSERSLRCLSQWRSFWDISETSHAGWVPKNTSGGLLLKNPISNFKIPLGSNNWSRKINILFIWRNASRQSEQFKKKKFCLIQQNRPSDLTWFYFILIWELKTTSYKLKWKISFKDFFSENVIRSPDECHFTYLLTGRFISLFHS